MDNFLLETLNKYYGILLDTGYSNIKETQYLIVLNYLNSLLNIHYPIMTKDEEDCILKLIQKISNESCLTGCKSITDLC